MTLVEPGGARAFVGEQHMLAEANPPRDGLADLPGSEDFCHALSFLRDIDHRPTSFCCWTQKRHPCLSWSKQHFVTLTSSGWLMLATVFGGASAGSAFGALCGF